KDDQYGHGDNNNHGAAIATGGARQETDQRGNKRDEQHRNEHKRHNQLHEKRPNAAEQIVAEAIEVEIGIGLGRRAKQRIDDFKQIAQHQDWPDYGDQAAQGAEQN